MFYLRAHSGFKCMCEEESLNATFQKHSAVLEMSLLC